VPAPSTTFTTPLHGSFCAARFGLRFGCAFSHSRFCYTLGRGNTPFSYLDGPPRAFALPFTTLRLRSDCYVRFIAAGSRLPLRAFCRSCAPLHILRFPDAAPRSRFYTARFTRCLCYTFMPFYVTTTPYRTVAFTRRGARAHAAVLVDTAFYLTRTCIFIYARYTFTYTLHTHAASHRCLPRFARTAALRCGSPAFYIYLVCLLTLTFVTHTPFVNAVLTAPPGYRCTRMLRSRFARSYFVLRY